MSQEIKPNESYNEMTDEEIVRLAQSDDAYAFECMFERYRDYIKVVASRYFLVGGDREDVLQEGMIGFFKAVRDYKPDKGASFKSFATICVRGQIITAIKKATRNKHIPLNQAVSLNQPMYFNESSDRTLMDTLAEPKECDPEIILLEKELLETIAQAVTKLLSDLELSVLVLYLRGVPYTEIARRINRPIKSVDNAIQRTKNKMGRHFKDL